jgi:hypothetical protein
VPERLNCFQSIFTFGYQLQIWHLPDIVFQQIECKGFIVDGKATQHY